MLVLETTSSSFCKFFLVAPTLFSPSSSSDAQPAAKPWRATEDEARDTHGWRPNSASKEEEEDQGAHALAAQETEAEAEEKERVQDEVANLPTIFIIVICSV
jgi:hypothetical protein